MNWGGEEGPFWRKAPPPLPKPHPFSPKDFCKGLWRNGRHGRPNLGARLPVRLQNLRRQWNVGREREKTQRERMVRHP